MNTCLNKLSSNNVTIFFVFVAPNAFLENSDASKFEDGRAQAFEVVPFFKKSCVC